MEIEKRTLEKKNFYWGEMPYSVTDKCHIFCRMAELQFKKCTDIVLLLAYISFFIVWQPPVGQGLLIFEASRSHSDTRRSIGLLWTSDHSDAQNSAWQNTKLKTDSHQCTRRDSNPQFQQASGRRSTPYTALLLMSTSIYECTKKMGPREWKALKNVPFSSYTLRSSSSHARVFFPNKSLDYFLPFRTRCNSVGVVARLRA